MLYNMLCKTILKRGREFLSILLPSENVRIVTSSNSANNDSLYPKIVSQNAVPEMILTLYYKSRI